MVNTMFACKIFHTQAIFTKKSSFDIMRKIQGMYMVLQHWYGVFVQALF